MLVRLHITIIHPFHSQRIYSSIPPLLIIWKITLFQRINLAIKTHFYGKKQGVVHYMNIYANYYTAQNSWKFHEKKINRVKQLKIG